jgi:NAD+ synthase (glutamine-hydrolysing)
MYHSSEQPSLNRSTFFRAGGADSSSVAATVAVMCILVTKASREDPEGEVARDCRCVCRKDDGNSLWVPSTPEEMANNVLHTTFMGTENSSSVTNSRAKRLADAIGSYHLSIKIDLMVKAVLQVFQISTGHMPSFTSRGGTTTEDLALQNIQALLRTVTAYLVAQLLPWVRGRSGFLLVLGSANVDEGLRGYTTKYDCSSADLSQIGAISKGDLKRMLVFLAKEYPGFEVLAEIANAPPTAELRPIGSATATAEAGHSQTDEEDMGVTYEELVISVFCAKCPDAAQLACSGSSWSSPSEVAAKVKRFFYYYSVNRHKMTTITPSYHAEAYSPDDNRFDLRRFLYNTRWTRQFSQINDIVARLPDSDNSKDKND